MRTEIQYYGFRQDEYGDAARQACYNQALYVYGQSPIGSVYLEGGIYYTTESGSDQAYNGTYLTTIGGSPYDNPANIYLEITGQTPATTSGGTTSAATTSGSTTSGGTTEEGATTLAPEAPPIGELGIFNAAIYIKAGLKDIIVIGQFWATFGLLTPLPPPYICTLGKELISYPDSRAYKMLVWITHEGTTWGGEIALKPSRAYNYSYAFMQGGVYITLYPMTAPTISNNLSYYEDDVVIASEIAVPFHFPVEHSYRIPGKITDMNVMSSQVMSIQIGLFPLLVFTDKGVYALEQGSGAVLYSRVTPVSNDVCQGRSVKTRYGVAYMGNGRLNLIQHSERLSLSDVLGRWMPDKTIRNSSGFVSAVAGSIYNIAGVLSDTHFSDYLAYSPILIYDSRHDEIIVSSSSFGYSYVFSLSEKSWHKITDVFVYSDGDIAVREVGTKYDIVYTDMEETAEGTLIHAQTRPVSLDSFGYKTVQRAILRGIIRPYTTGEASDDPVTAPQGTTQAQTTTPLPDNITLHGFYLFASNDLNEWKLISARQAAVDMLDMRMDRIAKGYRYFVFVFGGVVDVLYHNIAGIEVEYNDVLEEKSR